MLLSIRLHCNLLNLYNITHIQREFFKVKELIFLSTFMYYTGVFETVKDIP